MSKKRPTMTDGPKPPGISRAQFLPVLRKGGGQRMTENEIYYHNKACIALGRGSKVLRLLPTQHTSRRKG